jgi:hypothetical protein
MVWIETLKGSKYEKGNLTETVNMKKVTFTTTGFCFGMATRVVEFSIGVFCLRINILKGNY